MKFFKNGCNGGGVGSIMGGWEILEVSLHSWKRGVNPVILWRAPLTLPTPFFKIWPPPSPTFLSPPTPTALTVVVFLWLIGWSRHTWCATLLNDSMDLYTSSLSTLVPEGPWYMFYATRHQVYWGLTYNVVFYWYSNLISHTHKHKNTAHSGANRLTHTYSYIFAPLVMCSQQLPLLH